MFFNRIIRDLVLVSICFVLAINVYVWALQLQQYGNSDNFEYVGFYRFFQQLSSFPNFEYFHTTISNFSKWLGNLSDLEKILGLITLGVSLIAEILFYLGQMIVCLLADVLMIIRWLLEFLGIQNLVTIG